MNTYTQIEAEADPLGVLLEVGAGLIQIGNVSIPAGTPRIINQELTFPYLMGEQFVRALLAVDGWETVNAAYTDNPPLSTEHILHPERYLANDHPVAVTLTDDSILLGADWALVRQGVLGEFYLREWLLTAPEIDSDLVDVGATGWGGDAYHIYQDERGNYAYEMHLVWDTPDDAATFYYETLLAFGNQKTNTPAPDHYADSEAFCWVTDNQALCVAFTEGITRVVLAPDEGLAQGLIGN